MAEAKGKLALGAVLTDARDHCLIDKRREASTISTRSAVDQQGVWGVPEDCSELVHLLLGKLRLRRQAKVDQLDTKCRCGPDFRVIPRRAGTAPPQVQHGPDTIVIPILGQSLRRDLVRSIDLAFHDSREVSAGLNSQEVEGEPDQGKDKAAKQCGEETA